VKYLFDQNLIRSLGETKSVNWFVVTSTIMSLLVVFSMIFGHGRGRFGSRPIKMHRRNVSYKS